MAIQTTDVSRGMPVYGCDGTKIGTVAEVYGSEFGGEEPGLAPPNGDLPSGAPIPFLKVDRSGILGLGASELYVSADGVQEVAPAERIVLTCTRDDCTGLYAHTAEK